ncbi:MAG: tRNA lysidine(34) synthetase TilS [Acidobacteria bacterium]|nr:tRNA lysidine(34) synthetase TilS [Acidobacteriota bacterium]
MLLDRVRGFAAHRALWSPGTRVLVALSGGGDSVALLLVLDLLARREDLRLAGACHVHHHIRGAAADDDESFCRALTDRLGLPLVVAHRDVPALAASSGRSLEVAGRLARRTALVEAAGALGADRVATAHTCDDQAETVLLRIIRGTGVTGLGGIASQRELFIRPLLAESRQSLRDWLIAHGEPWREDASNEDVANPRNRVRHVLLPYLRRHFNPSADRALARLADLARADDEVIEAAADDFSSLIHVLGERVRIDAAGVAALPKALARRVVRRALEAAQPSRTYDLDEVDLVCAACAGPNRPPQSLRGLLVNRNGAHVVLGPREGVASHPQPFHYQLPVPGSVSVREAGWVVEADGPLPAASTRPAAGPLEVTVPAEPFEATLTVRSRAPGDRLRLRGVRGRTKLQDLFVNRKVSRADRDRTPLVTDATGRIVWVAGLALSDEFRVNERTNAVIVLKLRRI